MAHKKPSFKKAALPPLVPIVLGVTGHREIRPEDIPALRQAVADIFAEFRERHPHTPLRVLSALAPGADQLVAEVAEENKVEIHVPLPFPVEIYAASSTFDNFPAEREKFLDWVAKKKVASYVVPLPEGPKSTGSAGWEEFVNDAQKRHLCYANVGGYVVRHCHALIGLWNGKVTGLSSGTEEMVEYKLRGKRPPLYPWCQPLGQGDETGPVYIVHTPRKGEGMDPALPPGTLTVKVARHDYVVNEQELKWKPTTHARLRDFFASFGAEGLSEKDSETPDAHARRRVARWRQFLAITQVMDDFNRDIGKDLDPNELHAQVEGKNAALGNPVEKGRVPHEFHRLIWLRESAEALACQLDLTFLFWQRSLFIILFFGVTCFDAYDHQAIFRPWFSEGNISVYVLCGFPLAVMLCIAIATYVWHARIYERRLDYRALAETVRVRIHWALAGIGISVADSYLTQLRGEISWARTALKISAPPPSQWEEYFQRLPKEKQLEQLNIVEEHWVADQANFYRRTFKKRHLYSAIYRFFGLVIAFMAVGMVVGLIAGSALRGNSDRLGILVLTNMSVLVAALLLLYSERQSHEDLAKQYERMHEVFTKGAEDLKTYLHGDPASIDIPSAQAAIIALGDEAISEHSQWLILRRNRPFEVPVP
jgi:hypothetical protein